MLRNEAGGTWVPRARTNIEVKTNEARPSSKPWNNSGRHEPDGSKRAIPAAEPAPPTKSATITDAKWTQMSCPPGSFLELQQAMPYHVLVRSSLMLLMMGAVGLLAIQQFWIYRSARGQSLHLWASFLSLISLVFITARVIQHAGQTGVSGELGTRIQFVCGFLVGYVAVGLLRQLSKTPGARGPLGLVFLTSSTLSVLALTTDLFVQPPALLRAELTGNQYYVMTAGPLLLLLGPYTIVLAAYCTRLALRSTLGNENDRGRMMWAAAFIGLAMVNDILSVSEIFTSIQMLDVGFFAIALTVGYTVHREAELRYTGMKEEVASRGETIRRQEADLERSKEDLKASEERFRLLADSAVEGIAIHRDGRIIDGNRAMERMLGRKLAEEPCALEALWAPGSADIARRLVPDSEGADPIEVIIRHANGSTFPAEFSGREAMFREQSVGILTIRDLTERKRLEAQLMFADRIASLGRMAAGIGHEINNPLCYVAGNIEYLRDRLTSLVASTAERTECEESLSEALAGCRRIETIVRDLGMLARSREDEEKRAEISSVLDSSIRVATNEIRHRAQLIRDYGELPPAAISTTRLGQVILSLLVNAAHAIPPGHANDNRITLRTSLMDGRIEIAISDTGSGMTPDVLQNIFAPFYTTKPHGEGTGLGLSICQNIITSAGGEIMVESEPEEGTTFRLFLPVCDEKPASVEAADTPASSHHGRARILVVEDDESVSKFIERVLHDHSVSVIRNGPAAIEWCCREWPDLVLCDVMMPDIRGDEIYEAVRQREPRMADRFVFMTGGAFSEETRDFLACTTNPVLNKPLRLGVLSEVVNTALWESGGREGGS